MKLKNQHTRESIAIVGVNVLGDKIEKERVERGEFSVGQLRSGGLRPQRGKGKFWVRQYDVFRVVRG